RRRRARRADRPPDLAMDAAAESSQPVRDQPVQPRRRRRRQPPLRRYARRRAHRDRKSTRLNSSHVSISYAVFCLKKKNTYATVGATRLATLWEVAAAAPAPLFVPSRYQRSPIDEITAEHLLVAYFAASDLPLCPD